MTNRPEIPQEGGNQNPSENFPPDLNELLALIETLPVEKRHGFMDAAHRLAEKIENRRNILSFVQESLSQLRLDMKYMMFDLEATRHERDQYLNQLDKSQE